MTIPQIFSYVGWSLLTIAAAFVALHTINLAIPGVDYVMPSTEIGTWGYLIATPVIILGVVLAVIGRFGERIEQWWLDQQQDK